MNVRFLTACFAGLAVAIIPTLSLPSLTASRSSPAGQDDKPQNSPAPAASAPASPQETPLRPLRVAARAVEVSVRVTDKHGVPINGLTKDKFVVLDDKKPQTIGFFSVVSDQPASAPSDDPLPPDTYINGYGLRSGAAASVTVILLDSLNTSFLDQTRGRDAIMKYLRTIKPNDRVALFVLSDRLHVLHDFTSDASDLVQSLAQYKGKASADLDMKDTSLANEVNKALVAATIDSDIHEADAASPARAQITSTSLRLIADYLGGLPGRKNLVWVSAAFPFNIETSNLERTSDGQRLAYPSDQELTVRALLNANVSVYPVDATGLVATEVTDSAAVRGLNYIALAPVKALAARTGGRAYFDRNDIMNSVRDAVNDSNLNYEIGFYPANVKWDGSYHTIRVKVEVPGAQVQARDGYFALGDVRATPETRMALLAEAARGPLDATELSIRAHITPGGPSDEPDLKIGVNLDMHQFDFVETNGTWNELVDLAFVQLDAKNQIIRTSRESYPFALDRASLDQLTLQGLSLEEYVPLREGAVQLRVIVREGGRGSIGSLRIPLAPYLPAPSK
jgi:VWFA-related protein